MISELTIKVVNTGNIDKVLYLRDQPKPTKHLSFHPSGSYLAASCTDGVVYIYSLSTEEPKLVRKVDDLIRTLETDAEASSRAIWHPDGRAFAAPTATRGIQVVSRSDGERQKTFSGGHMGDVTALAWSPNGALLMTAGTDRKIMLWETKIQKVVARFDSSSFLVISANAEPNSDTTTRASSTLSGTRMRTWLPLPLRMARSTYTPISYLRSLRRCSNSPFSQLPSSMTRLRRLLATPASPSLMVVKTLSISVQGGEEPPTASTRS